MKTFLYTSAALYAAFCATAAMAETSASVDELVVTANRTARPAGTVGGQITVLDTAEIEASQAVTVSDLVARAPGVAVTRNGPVGAVTAVRIRGAEADHTVVLIDGVKLNDPAAVGGGYNFGSLLVGDVGRVEILRGPQSVLWGSQAIGGVVNLITADPDAPFETSLDAEAGTRGTGYLRAGVGGAGERLVWRVAAAHYTTDGDSAFAGGTEDDGFRQDGASGKLKLTITEALSAELRGHYTQGRLAFDGFPAPSYAFADTAEYGERRELLGYAGLNLALLDGRFDNRLAYAWTGEDSDNVDPAQAVTTRTFDSRGTNGRWEYQGALALSETWRAVFGAESERSTIRSSSPSSFDPNPAPLRRGTTQAGAYAQVQVEPAAGLTLTAGLRRDDHDAFGGSTVGQASVAYAFNDKATVLRASWGEGFKAPTLYQLYSEYGNAGLDPEAAESWDAGVEHTLLAGAVTLSAAWFARDTTNQIDFFSCATADPNPLCVGAGGARRFGYYANTASTQAHGVELAASARLGERLTADGVYTWTDTENTSAGAANRGRELIRRPQTTATLELGYLWPIGLSTTAAVRHVSDSWDNAANTRKLKAHTLADLRFSYPVNERIEVHARVENLMDEDYETAGGYGGLGRTATVGVRARY